MVHRRGFLAAMGSGVAAVTAGCLETGGVGQLLGSADAQTGDSSVATRDLMVATTTSADDTGILDKLNAEFEDRFDVQTKVVAQGTGAALETARRGDADVLVTHAPDQEREFVDGGYGADRLPLMYNDFLLVGPAADPAGIGEHEDPITALGTIADQTEPFLSRGDSSGTHVKELALWDQAGANPGGTWYREAGSGMGDVLTQASMTGAYTLTDRGTYLAMADQLDLVVHVTGPMDGGPESLRNPYSVIPVAPSVSGGDVYDLAMAYAGYLTGPDGQEQIAAYRVDGDQLFEPATDLP